MEARRDAATHHTCSTTAIKDCSTRLAPTSLKRLSIVFLRSLPTLGSTPPAQQKKQNIPCGTLCFLIGGGGGSRTRVRKHIHTGISERSHLLNIPSTARQVTAHAVLVASFVLYGAKLSHIMCTTAWRSYPSRGPLGKNGRLIRQRKLIYC